MTSSTSDNQRANPTGQGGLRGIILLYHGSAGREWLQNAEWMARIVAGAAPMAAVRIGCLKEFSPSLEDAAAALAQAGAVTVLVVPMFIAPGGHSTRDFPPLADGLKKRWPEIDFIWTEVVGAWDEVAEAVAAGLKNRLDQRETQ